MWDIDFTKMTYKEFKSWCNARACDGLWSVNQAVAFTSIIEEINAVKASGLHLFRTKANEKAQEIAWQEYCRCN